jgi:hypothetical protein
LDIHKPKPIHGFRELMGEIAIIVVGVLIALGAEQAVETIHWKHKIAEAEAAIRLELSDDDGPQAYTRVSIAPCLAQSLNAIEAALEAGADRPRIAALTAAYTAPFRTWDMEAWRATLASDVANRISSKRMIALATPYNLVPLLGETNQREARDYADLRAGGRAPGPLSPLERERVAVSISRLRLDQAFMRQGAEVLLHGAHDVGIDTPAATKRALVAEARRQFGPCAVEPPPESALTAPSSTSLRPIANQ